MPVLIKNGKQRFMPVLLPEMIFPTLADFPAKKKP
jgi:hypothetical protein